jgi:hypothetical protein
MSHLKCIAIFLALAVTAPMARSQDGSSMNGRWSGGVGSLVIEDSLWASMTVELAVEHSDRRGRAGVTGTLLGREELSLTGALDGDQLTLSLRRNGRRETLTGTLDGSWFRGTLRRGSQREDVLLMHESTTSEETIGARIGVYATDEGLVIVRQSLHLVMHLLGSGELRVIYDRGTDGMLSGPSLSRPEPAAWHTTFEEDLSGTVIGLSIDRGDDGVLHGTRLGPTRSEEFQFETSDGTTLRGTLYLPEGEGPHPVALWVHGSGRAAAMTSTETASD